MRNLGNDRAFPRSDRSESTIPVCVSVGEQAAEVARHYDQIPSLEKYRRQKIENRNFDFLEILILSLFLDVILNWKLFRNHTDSHQIDVQEEK